MSQLEEREPSRYFTAQEYPDISYHPVLLEGKGTDPSEDDEARRILEEVLVTESPEALSANTSEDEKSPSDPAKKKAKSATSSSNPKSVLSGVSLTQHLQRKHLQGNTRQGTDNSVENIPRRVPSRRFTSQILDERDLLTDEDLKGWANVDTHNWIKFLRGDFVAQCQLFLLHIGQPNEEKRVLADWHADRDALKRLDHILKDKVKDGTYFLRMGYRYFETSFENKIHPMNRTVPFIEVVKLYGNPFQEVKVFYVGSRSKTVCDRFSKCETLKQLAEKIGEDINSHCALPAGFNTRTEAYPPRGMHFAG